MDSQVRQRRSSAAQVAFEGGAQLRPLRPQTMVDLVIDAIVPAAAAGVILPGDRIVEADLALSLIHISEPTRPY